VDEAIRRIMKRGRDYELIVERAYWERLNAEYETYFNQYNISEVLTINVDHLDFEANEDDREYILMRILERLNEIDSR
jgi:deoxyadenosine/deoxycytidine kinase